MFTEMTPKEYREALRSINLSPDALAIILDVHPRTAKRWLRGSTPIPAPVAILLRIWQTNPDTRIWRRHRQSLNHDGSNNK